MEIVDEKGNILFQNENLKSLFEGESLGKKCWELYRDDKTQCTDCPLRSGVTIGKTDTIESDGILGNRIFEINHTGMMYRGKKAMLEIFQDITLRKQNEEELIKAKEKAEESDRLKTSFLHNISHEIRTPMNAIIGFSGFLGDPDLLPDKRKYFNDIIMQSCTQLLSIISDIVSIATIQAGQEKIIEKEIDIKSMLLLLYEQFSSKAATQNISLINKACVNENDVQILCDETKLIQVLTNLIGNALKFTHHGTVSFGCTVKGTELEFFVKDTGIGIPAEMHIKIFERFRQVENSSTRQYGGSGLGLSISKAYIEILGGKIWLHSEPDKGSTFFFTIPYKKVVKSPIHEIQVIPGPKIEKGLIKTILIAEDEDSNFMLLEALMEDMNISIIRAINGIEAVELCSSSKKIDLVLMDIKMPMMDGFEATRKIRKFNTSLPIIAQTAFTSEADKREAIVCGCNDFITKPIRNELVISKVSEYLGRSG
jgi:signal transduction histidine kinase